MALLLCGFCDDWQVEVLVPIAMRGVMLWFETFQRASGQIVNEQKTCVLPTQHLSEQEQSEWRSIWTQCQITYRKKLLGLWAGLEVSPEEVCAEIEGKLGDQLAVFTAVPMSKPIKVFTVNTFCLPMFSFIWRALFIPDSVKRRADGMVRRFSYIFVTDPHCETRDLWTRSKGVRHTLVPA